MAITLNQATPGIHYSTGLIISALAETVEAATKKRAMDIFVMHAVDPRIEKSPWAEYIGDPENTTLGEGRWWEDFVEKYSSECYTT